MAGIDYLTVNKYSVLILQLVNFSFIFLLNKGLHFFQGRQKLARFNALEFASLIVDILHDAKNREGLNTENQSSGQYSSSVLYLCVFSLIASHRTLL